ncbi:hypothetical protein [uncultured Muribaculum sp.]|nr:hypothetical protein [uncultured Muribaculum sp.]
MDSSFGSRVPNDVSYGNAMYQRHFAWRMMFHAETLCINGISHGE